jgi:GT2 family glycosyltransferase
MLRVSVVVPTYRRPDLLARCLEALARQEMDPTSFEVIVADDAAGEDARELVQAHSARSAAALRHVPVVGAHGPAAARNAGWRAARGAIIAFTDDDCLPDPVWLPAGLAAFSDDVAAVAGRVIVPLPSRPTDYQRDAAGLEGAEFVTANCFCRRSALEEIGGFDERFQVAWREDSDLQFALLERGHRIGCAPEAVVVHPVRAAGWGISLRQQRKGLFDALLYKKHPALYRSRLGASPLWDYYAIIASLAATAGFAWAGRPRPALAAGAVWAALTARFCARRLRGTSPAPSHVAEMVVTSALIPPLSVFWRLYGAWRFRVPFL